MTTLSSIVLFVLFPVFVLIIALLWLTESREQKIRRWVQSGISQRAIAKKLGVSRYYVAKTLKAS